MSIKRWLAAKLWPDFERTERRFWHLWNQVDDVNKWCDGEARMASQWLLDQDADYVRPLDAAPVARRTPGRIMEMRSWLYARRAALEQKESR